jgi:hypothetical protein
MSNHPLIDSVLSELLTRTIEKLEVASPAAIELEDLRALLNKQPAILSSSRQSFDTEFPLSGDDAEMIFWDESTNAYHSHVSRTPEFSHAASHRTELFTAWCKGRHSGRTDSTFTNSSNLAHCPICKVVHTQDETCIAALTRMLSLYEGRAVLNSTSSEWPEALIKLEAVMDALTRSDSSERLHCMDAGKTLREAIDILQASRSRENQSSHVVLRFPSMLRRMWSGGEVQQWLEEQGPLFRHPQVSPGDTATLERIYDLFGIRGEGRTPSTLLTNIENVKRFADLLDAVESEFLMVPGDPSGEPEDEDAAPDDRCLVNRWGSTQPQYIEQFRRALVLLASKQNKSIAEFIEIVRGCYVLASSYSGTLDGVDENGGDDHEDPICAVFHRLYYAMFLVDPPARHEQGQSQAIVASKEEPLVQPSPI